MLMLDCVLQLGLNHGDYHSGYLTYEHLKRIMKKPECVTAASKVKFEV